MCGVPRALSLTLLLLPACAHPAPLPPWSARLIVNVASSSIPATS
jgi:hypothetical protein